MYAYKHIRAVFRLGRLLVLSKVVPPPTQRFAHSNIILGALFHVRPPMKSILKGDVFADTVRMLFIAILLSQEDISIRRIKSKRAKLLFRF